MANALTTIRKRAEAIRRRHPKMKYQSALKKAGSEYRHGKIKGHKIAGKGSTRKTTRRPARMAGTGGDGSFSQKKNSYKAELKSRLGWLLATQRTARTKKEKKALQPQINELTRQLKALE
jgi:hypothetical protein